MLGRHVGGYSRCLVVRLCRSARHDGVDAAALNGRGSGGVSVVRLGGDTGRDCNARRDGVGNHHVQVGRIGCVCCRVPTVLRASEGRQTVKRRLQSWSAEEGGVLLCGCAQGALRKSNAGARVSGMQVAHGWHEPQWTVAGMQEDWRSHVTAIGGMLEDVFGAGISSGAKQRDGAFPQKVRLRKFALMLCRDVQGSPAMCSRSRTGGGPPSGTSASKNRVTEKV
eukprot:3258488-Pleurochrysis_carterae.AAC.4